MWSFWSRDPTKDFGYEIGDIVSSDDKSFWVLHKAKKKSTGEQVSIFRYEAKPNASDNIDKAKNAVKRLKTLRHPSILTYVDSLETDKIVCLVTEYVEPLDKYLQTISEYTSQQKQFAISWGLHQVSKGLGFLVNDCNLTHNNICLPSIFVNSCGIWRIGGLEYVCNNADDIIPSKVLASQQKYTPPERIDSSRRSSGPKWCVDSWGLGCLIWEVFNGPLPEAIKLKSIGKIPKSLVSQYTELITNNPNNRLSPADFVNKCRLSNGFFKNSFIDAMLFLEEIQIKETSEKNRFFSNLDNQLDSFPKDICKNKILPQLVTAFEFSNAGSAILGPLFKIGKSLDNDEYQKKIVPCVVKLFACKDRATRAKLLQQMESFINYVQPNVVNEQVFPHVAQGFLDSNPVIREQTVKCMLHMSSKLNYHNLNEEVLKNFARLQARDEEGGIRTNTTVCLGKIANHLHPHTRQTVLIPAFLRSMRDPFPPARIAGILALSATQNFYSLRECSTRVMPALCHLILDPEKQVREQSIKALKGFVSKFEKVSEDPSLIEQMEADLNASGSNVSSTLAASWAGWAVSSLAAKFYRSKSSTEQVNSSQLTLSKDNLVSTERDKSNEERPTTPLAPAIQKSESGESIPDFDEGDIDWGSMDTTSNQNATNKKSLDGWDEEEWNEYDANEETQSNSVEERRTSLTPQTPTAAPVERDEFFDNYSTTKTTAQTTKQKPKIDWNTNETQNWENKWTDEDKNAKLSKSSAPLSSNLSEENKRKAEERRQQRVKEMEERKSRKGAKGPMKLGAQRIT